MVKQSMDLLELLRKRGMDGDVDLLREALRVLVDGIMDAEVSAQIGAERGERSPERVTYRNGYRNRTWDTRVGTMELHIPKVREGSYFPSLLEPRRRSEAAALTWGDVQRWGDGSGRMTVIRSKTDTEAQGAVVAITPPCGPWTRSGRRAWPAVRRSSGCRIRKSTGG